MSKKVSCTSNEKLAVAIQAGNGALIGQLWEQCYGFIRLQAARFFRAWDGTCSFELDDLIQQGYFGLCDACKTFQPEKASFCHWLSLHLKTAFADVAGCRTMAQKMEPLNGARSLDEPAANSTGEDVEATKGDFIADPQRADIAVNDEVFRLQCADILRCKIAQLNQNQQTAIELKYWHNATDQAIADVLQCSRTYANTTVKNGLATLRKQDIDHTLRKLLDDMYYENRNLYAKTGLGFFNSTGSSSPEYEVMRKDEKERQRKKANQQREKEISLLMEYFHFDRATAEQYCS